MIYFNASNSSQSCPPGLELIEHPLRLCGIRRRARGYSACQSTFFTVPGGHYTRLRGRIIGLQNGTTYGFFGGSDSARNNINEAYLDGVSLTHGNSTHRRHLWSFATGYSQLSRDSRIYSCPEFSLNSPWFVEQNFFHAGCITPTSPCGIGVAALRPLATTATLTTRRGSTGNSEKPLTKR